MTAQQAGSANFWPHPFEWGNYAKVFDLFPALHYTLNTVTYAVLSTIGVLFSSILVAYALSRMQWRGRHGVFLFVVFALMVPTHVGTGSLFVGFVSLPHICALTPPIVPAR